MTPLSDIRGIGQSHPSWEFFRRPDMAASGAAVSGRMRGQFFGCAADNLRAYPFHAISNRRNRDTSS